MHKVICYISLQANLPSNVNSTSAIKQTSTKLHDSANSQVKAAEKYVILMRHGQTDWNREGRIQGSLDKSCLTANGIRQAQIAGQYLKDIQFDSIYCSPLRRAKDTLKHMRVASANSDLMEIIPQHLDALKEIHVPWQGLLRTEIQDGIFRQHYAAYRKNANRFTYFGYSPVDDLRKRVESVWQSVHRNEGTCQIVISHNQTNKALICAGLDMETNLSLWYQNNCGFNVFVVRDGYKPQLRLSNGSDPNSLTEKPKRASRQNDFIRLFVHRSGSWDGINHEIASIDVSHAYIMEGISLPNDTYQNLQRLHATISTFDILESSNELLYTNVESFLDMIRRKHNNENIIVFVNSESMYEILFAASAGLDKSSLDRLCSDPGGVSVVDIPSKKQSFQGRLIQCYNAYAFPFSEPLKGYTCNM